MVLILLDYQHIGYLMNITSIFESWHQWTVHLVWSRHFVKLEIHFALMKKLTNADLVTNACNISNYITIKIGMTFPKFLYLFMITNKFSVTEQAPDLVLYHSASSVNTLRPRPNGQYFADDTFKCVFLNENTCISINISLKFVPKGSIHNIPALVQIMAWRRQATRHYLNQWW